MRPCAVDGREEANLPGVQSGKLHTQQEAEDGHMPSQTPPPLPDHLHEGGYSHPDGRKERENREIQKGLKKKGKRKGKGKGKGKGKTQA